MAPDDERELIEAVVTCEGNLHDPDFSERFQRIVDKLKSVLYTKNEKEPFKVRKIEPWNSVRVTISIPKEAAQKLRHLAQQGSNVLRDLGILSVQVEGDQVISLTIAGPYNEPQEIILHQKGSEEVEAGSSSGSSKISSAGVPSLDILSSSSAFRSPNVVAPSGESIPLLPKNATTPKTPLGGPFPFASMTHAAQNMQGRAEPVPGTSSTNSSPAPSPAPNGVPGSPLLKGGPLLVTQSPTKESVGRFLLNAVPHPPPTQLCTLNTAISQASPMSQSLAGAVGVTSVHPSSLAQSPTTPSGVKVVSGLGDKGPPVSSPLLINLLQSQGAETVSPTGSLSSEKSSAPSTPPNIMLPPSSSPLPENPKQVRFVRGKRGVSLDGSPNQAGGSTSGSGGSSSEPPSPGSSSDSFHFNVPEGSQRFPIPVSTPSKVVAHKPTTTVAEGNQIAPNVTFLQAKGSLVQGNFRLLAPQNTVRTIRIGGPTTPGQILINTNGPVGGQAKGARFTTPNNVSLSMSNWLQANQGKGLETQRTFIPINTVSVNKGLVAAGAPAFISPSDVKGERGVQSKGTPSQIQNQTVRGLVFTERLKDGSTLQGNPQLTSSGKPRQFLINPLTGHLEPMPSESSSESDEDEDEEEDERPDKTHLNPFPNLTGMKEPAEKIKLRLKLEKSEPVVSPAYKIEMSIVKKGEKGGNVGLGPQPQPSPVLVSEQPRVPPLHISLRGRNAAVVVSPRREEAKGEKLTLPVPDNLNAPAGSQETLGKKRAKGRLKEEGEGEKQRLLKPPARPKQEKLKSEEGELRPDGIVIEKLNLLKSNTDLMGNVVPNHVGEKGRRESGESEGGYESQLFKHLSQEVGKDKALQNPCDTQPEGAEKPQNAEVPALHILNSLPVQEKMSPPPTEKTLTSPGVLPQQQQPYIPTPNAKKGSGPPELELPKTTTSSIIPEGKVSKSPKPLPELLALPHISPSSSEKPDFSNPFSQKPPNSMLLKEASGTAGGKSQISVPTASCLVSKTTSPPISPSLIKSPIEKGVGRGMIPGISQQQPSSSLLNKLLSETPERTTITTVASAHVVTLPMKSPKPGNPPTILRRIHNVPRVSKGTSTDLVDLNLPALPTLTPSPKVMERLKEEQQKKEMESEVVRVQQRLNRLGGGIEIQLGPHPPLNQPDISIEEKSDQELGVSLTNAEPNPPLLATTSSQVDKPEETELIPINCLPLLPSIGKTEDQNGAQGEDSGIDSMDALSEKSPNQGESPARKENEPFCESNMGAPLAETSHGPRTSESPPHNIILNEEREEQKEEVVEDAGLCLKQLEEDVVEIIEGKEEEVVEIVVPFENVEEENENDGSLLTLMEMEVEPMEVTVGQEEETKEDEIHLEDEIHQEHDEDIPITDIELELMTESPKEGEKEEEENECGEIEGDDGEDSSKTTFSEDDNETGQIEEKSKEVSTDQEIQERIEIPSVEIGASSTGIVSEPHERIKEVDVSPSQDIQDNAKVSITLGEEKDEKEVEKDPIPPPPPPPSSLIQVESISRRGNCDVPGEVVNPLLLSESLSDEKDPSDPLIPDTGSNSITLEIKEKGIGGGVGVEEERKEPSSIIIPSSLFKPKETPLVLQEPTEKVEEKMKEIEVVEVNALLKVEEKLERVVECVEEAHCEKTLDEVQVEVEAKEDIIQSSKEEGGEEVPKIEIPPPLEEPEQSAVIEKEEENLAVNADQLNACSEPDDSIISLDEIKEKVNVEGGNGGSLKSKTIEGISQQLLQLRKKAEKVEDLLMPILPKVEIEERVEVREGKTKVEMAETKPIELQPPKLEEMVGVKVEMEKIEKKITPADHEISSGVRIQAPDVFSHNQSQSPFQMNRIVPNLVRPKMPVGTRSIDGRIPISTGTVVSSNSFQGCAPISIGVSSSATSTTLTKVSFAPISVTNSNTSTTVFTIHPSSMGGNFHPQQIPATHSSIAVLPSGHKMVPIKLVRIPEGTGGQGPNNRVSPTYVEVMSRTGSPKASLMSVGGPVPVQTSPLNLSSISGGVQFVPLSSSNSSQMKVLVSSAQGKMGPQMFLKSVVMANHSTPIRVIRPQNQQKQAQTNLSGLSLLTRPPVEIDGNRIVVQQPIPLEKIQVNQLSPKGAVIKNTQTISLHSPRVPTVKKSESPNEADDPYDQLDGVEILDTGSPGINDDDLPFEADIIHDEKDLADVLAGCETIETTHTENGIDSEDVPFDLSRPVRKLKGNHRKSTDSLQRNDSPPMKKMKFEEGTHCDDKSTSSKESVSGTVKSEGLSVRGDSIPDSPIPLMRASSPLFTYSNPNRPGRSSRGNSIRNSRSPSPPQVEEGERDLLGEDQEIIDCLSRSPSEPRLSPQNKPNIPDDSDDDDSCGEKQAPNLIPDHTYGLTKEPRRLEQLSIEIPQVDLMVNNNSPNIEENSNVSRKPTRSTRSNTRLVSPDITAFRSDTPKLQKLTTKADVTIARNSPKPSPTGSLNSKVLSPNPVARGSPVLNSPYLNSSGKGSGAGGGKNIGSGIANNNRKRQASESSSASKDENVEEKTAEIDLNSRPNKRRSSENAAELIKACIGIEDTPKRNTSLIKKLEESSKIKEAAKKKQQLMSVLIEEEEDMDGGSVDLSLRGRGGRSSRGSSEDRSSSRGSSVHRNTFPSKAHTNDDPKEIKSNARINHRPKDKGGKGTGRESPHLFPNANKKDETMKGNSEPKVGRRSNRNNPSSKEKSPLTPAKTRTNVRKDVGISEKASTPSTSPENENPRRKTRSSVAGMPESELSSLKRRRISKDTKS